MYAICGANGNTGRVVAEALLAKGKKVRGIGRDEAKLKFISDKGGEIYLADMTDSAALTKAFAGAEAVYALIPPNMAIDDFRAFQKQVVEAVTQAVTDSRVKYVVLLSSFGADQPSGTGPIVGLYEFEQNLKSISGLNVLSCAADILWRIFL